MLTMDFNFFLHFLLKTKFRTNLGINLVPERKFSRFNNTTYHKLIIIS
jgi:glycopeptide antibiotics resistance protein